ncbi:hypothetical protein pb186bvf_019320 [Paramecium bursaria]
MYFKGKGKQMIQIHKDSASLIIILSNKILKYIKQFLQDFIKYLFKQQYNIFKSCHFQLQNSNEYILLITKPYLISLDTKNYHIQNCDQQSSYDNYFIRSLGLNVNDCNTNPSLIILSITQDMEFQEIYIYIYKQQAPELNLFYNLQFAYIYQFTFQQITRLSNQRVFQVIIELFINLHQMKNTIKKVKQIFSPETVPEGKGAKVTRIIGKDINLNCKLGTDQIPFLNPFLMLDYYHVQLPAGFPDHPHRGFETVTYQKKGQILHEDFKGNKGTLNPGDLQWMTAGKGIMHAEMPGSYEEVTQGFQLWLNLQSKDKMCDPQYQEYKSANIPEIIVENGTKIRMIAGEAYGQKGIIHTRTPTFYLDVFLNPNSKYEQKIPAGWNGFCFIYEGNASFSGVNAKTNQTILLETTQEEEILEVISTEQSKFILISGQPINEPIEFGGPFVMNTKQEIQQAYQDYQNGRNGFEGANQWKSKIRELAHKRS